jgi:hypothetical protein
MVKNATKLYYPIKEAIESILPIVDEFVIALGDCDADDTTLQEIQSIQSDKVKIVHTVWDTKKYPRGMENAHQTDIAKSHCTGDWLFYVQADEVVHEQYHAHIVEACQKYKDDTEVEGLLFRYVHFWGDYDHYQISHGWYKKEIRIVKNHPDIHSWESAQSFRRIPNFDGLNYRQQEGTFKLKVALIDAYIYHYGWVRPPSLMQSKNKSLNTIHRGADEAQKMYSTRAEYYDYGALGRMGIFKGTHPAVMQKRVAQFFWQDQLNYSKKIRPDSLDKHKHDHWRYRMVTWFEQNILGGEEIFAFRNYVRTRTFSSKHK